MYCKFFWWFIRRTYPWLPLAVTVWRLVGSTDNQRDRVRFWSLYSRIDFASLLALAIDLMQPEFWLM